MTEPGKPVDGMRPGLAALFVVVFSALGIHWLLQAVTAGSLQDRWFSVIFGVVFLGLATGYSVLWQRARRRPPPDKP